MKTNEPAGAAKFADFKGDGKRLDNIDIPRIGALIGVGEDEIHAFMDVEAAGSGFDGQGRPKMLFEPHVFYRNLNGMKRDQAVKAGLAYPKWKKGYPKDSYPRLVKAMAIDETAALKSASWGLGQTLGENHAMVGYSTPQAMVLAFMADEQHQLEAIVQFLIKAGIDDDLKAHRWTTVARVYNGPKYAENKYDTKMAAAFAKWAKIKDTPYASSDQAAKPAVAEKKSSDTIAFVQQRLKELGYSEVGAADGILGKMTKTAILAFRNENDLPLSDAIDEQFLIAIAQAKPRNLPRNDAKPADVRAVAPEVQSNWLTKLGAGAAAGVTAVAGAGDAVLAKLSPWRSFLADTPTWVWFAIAAAVFAAIFLVARRGEAKGVEAYQAGERR